MSRFEPVDPQVGFPALEEKILAFWKDADIFAKSLELRAGAPEWVFYEGPPTANGKPGIHHCESRTFKDVYPRFKTMTGYSVPRKAGWDCHGLPVELEVEKQIGTKSKSDIEAFGIEEFTRLCRRSVTEYVDDWERLTERIGFWLDLSDAYWTMSTEYVESVWWSLKHLFDEGLLVEDYKVTAYCPRCGTALSDAEVALGYEETDDPSVFLALEITECPGDPDLAGARIAVWTTTPWTLLSNLGLAIDPAATYSVLDHDGLRLIIAQPLREQVLPGANVLADLPGERLIGARYTPPFENVETGTTHTVVAGDFVSMEDGTGVVHIAPAFGPDDLQIGRANGWPVYNPVDAEGTFTAEAPEFVHGRFVKDADPHIIEDLERRGLLLRAETYTHSYPFCWRCRTPLLYYARTSWYIRTTARKERLLDVNEEVNWFPAHIKDGRYGNWLENNVDWALSRDRYWGTPLPIWRCGEGHTTAVGSLAELGELAGRDVADVDPHRPSIDAVTVHCPECGQEARRVPEVADTWYDSGAMPFAQWGYPYAAESRERFEARFPADFISEAIDQTRGWFYTLMAEGVLHFDETAYRNVVCLGHIVDADGRKMSKSLGNVIDPWDVLNRQGADALRWFLLTSGSPWASRRVGMDILDQSVRQFLLTLWNVYAFFVTYANADGFDPETAPAAPASERPVLDRWLLSQLADTVRVARDGLETYDATGAGRRIATFVDDLSNWYVRRARRRFWDPAGEANEADKAAAYRTLHESLLTLSQLLAPFTPFVAEELWRQLSGPSAPESVHLSDYPEPADAGAPDAVLDAGMAAARGVVEIGRRIRAEHGVKTRQPLGQAVVHLSDPGPIEPLLDLIAEELNVRSVTFAHGDHLGWRARPNFRVLGPRFGPKMKEFQQLLRDDASGGGGWARSWAGEETVAVTFPSDGSTEDIAPTDVELMQDSEQGWGVGTDGVVTVTLDLELTDELRIEGVARDLVRVIQDARKAAGLDVSDRIELGIETSGDVAEALETFGDYIRKETLAAAIARDALEGDVHRETADLGGAPTTVTLRRV